MKWAVLLSLIARECDFQVRILSTLNRELLKPSASVALHRHSNALVDVLPPEADSSISLLSQSEKPDVTYQVFGVAPRLLICFARCPTFQFPSLTAWLKMALSLPPLPHYFLAERLFLSVFPMLAVGMIVLYKEVRVLLELILLSQDSLMFRL